MENIKVKISLLLNFKHLPTDAKCYKIQYSLVKQPSRDEFTFSRWSVSAPRQLRQFWEEKLQGHDSSLLNVST